MLIFTDLDGTLIDHDSYSWEAAKEAIGRLKSKGIPIIPCTSKTRAEIEFYRGKIGLGTPFISENGGGIFIPKGYLGEDIECDKETGEYQVIELGIPYEEIRAKIDELRDFGDLCGFGDMSFEEVAEDTGLCLEQARLAKEREYDEAFVFSGDEEGLVREIERLGLNWTKGGRYWHIMGDNNKGKAVEILIATYAEESGRAPKTVAFGDSLNDLPMLKAVDSAILVQKKNGSYDPRVDFEGLIKAEKPGPEGWNDEILKIINR